MGRRVTSRRLAVSGLLLAAVVVGLLALRIARWRLHEDEGRRPRSHDPFRRRGDAGGGGGGGEARRAALRLHHRPQQPRRQALRRRARRRPGRGGNRDLDHGRPPRRPRHPRSGVPFLGRRARCARRRTQSRRRRLRGPPLEPAGGFPLDRLGPARAVGNRAHERRQPVAVGGMAASSPHRGSLPPQRTLRAAREHDTAGRDPRALGHPARPTRSARHRRHGRPRPARHSEGPRRPLSLLRVALRPRAGPRRPRPASFRKPRTRRRSDRGGPR